MDYLKEVGLYDTIHSLDVLKFNTSIHLSILPFQCHVTMKKGNSGLKKAALYQWDGMA